MRQFFSFARLFSNLKPSKTIKNSGGGAFSLSIKALASLALAQSVAFGDFLFVSTADKDWLPTNDKALANSNTITLPYGKNKAKNFIMDIGGDGPLGYGGNQKYTITINVADDNSENVAKDGYFELIVDMNLAKSVLVSQAQNDADIKAHIANKEVTPPSVYGKYENKGINFALRSQNASAGINYGLCEVANSKTDSTLKQFKMIIPKNSLKHQLVVYTDSKFADCKRNAQNSNDTKSYLYGVRMSIKHVNQPFSGVDSTGTIITGSLVQSNSSTYNLPTLIIGREDVLPSYCTYAMQRNNKYACKPEPNIPNQIINKERNGNSKQLLWAACGEADDVKNEIDCRKPGASCDNRINTSTPQKWNNRGSGNLSRKQSHPGGNYTETFKPYRNTSGQVLFNFEEKCWEEFYLKSSIYSSGYYFERKQFIEQVNDRGGCQRDAYCNLSGDTMWFGHWALAEYHPKCEYRHYVKTPKLFTISLRNYANRNNSNMEHENIPHFEAKFAIVNASTQTGNYYSAPKLEYFKDVKCYTINKNGQKGGEKVVKIERQGGSTGVNAKSVADTLYITIKSKDIDNNLKGKDIQCRFEYTDYNDGKKIWPNNDWNAFASAGLYYDFAYNFQLASLKIVNTPNSSYRDLSLNTKCSFPKSWRSRPGRVSGNSFLAGWHHPTDSDVPVFNGALDYTDVRGEVYDYSVKECSGCDLYGAVKSAQRHFRFDARPLFYVAKNIDQNVELYSGYKYHENANLNQNASNLKFLYDQKENEKLIETAIKFPKDYKGNKVEKIQIIGARDAENKEIIMNDLTSKLKGTMASIYARDDELETSSNENLSGVDFVNVGNEIKSSWVKNCFINNICRSVWGDLAKERVNLGNVTADGNAKQSTFSAFIYTDIFEGNKYLTYDNVGKTVLSLRDSDYTAFSQTHKGTHNSDGENLCEAGEVRAIYTNTDYSKIRVNGKGKGAKDPANDSVYGCDIPVVTEPKLENFAEYKTFKFYTFNPAMIKINSAIIGKAVGSSLYHSNKFIYNRGKCSNYPTYPEIACRDDMENSRFKIQVGATGLTRADIEANNFLTRYDGTAVSSDDVSIRGSVLEPIIVHQGRDTTKSNNTKSITEEFNFKIKNQDLENLYLAPRCVSEFSIRQGGMVLNCKSGDKVDENNYIAKGLNTTPVPITDGDVSIYGKMHDEQTHWQNLVNKKGEADITIFKSGFINGVAELDNIQRVKGKEDESLGLVFGKGGQSTYSLLQPSNPRIPEDMVEKVEVPVDTKTNTWIETPKSMSVMSDTFGSGIVLDVTLIAPNKQVGTNKDNAVFLATYISKPEIAKKLVTKGIIGEIIPGYANYYRIRRDAFGNNLKDKFFTYTNVEFIEPVKDNKNDGDFLRIADIDNEATATLIPSADGDKSYILYCNFIRNCYPLGDGTYGAKFRGFANKDTNWSKDNGQGSTILDKARTRPTQRRIAW